jgi:hypothetical protein
MVPVQSFEDATVIASDVGMRMLKRATTHRPAVPPTYLKVQAMFNAALVNQSFHTSTAAISTGILPCEVCQQHDEDICVVFACIRRTMCENVIE